MPIFKYSNALNIKTKLINTTNDKAGRRKFASESERFSNNLLDRASEILNDKCTPEKYLFTHITIVCSVDTKDLNVKTGSNVLDGFQTVNRPYTNYRVLPHCVKYINNNDDCWDRPVLLKSYPTFIGADNFCFVAGTKILMPDYTYKNIEDIKLDEEVISHTGNIKRVTHLFEREYCGNLHKLDVLMEFFSSSPISIFCTPNHPFLVLRDNEQVWLPCEELKENDLLVGYGNTSLIPVMSNEIQKDFSGKVYNIEVEEEHSYVVYPGVSVHNCEHVQLEEHSKGKVIDAIPRDIGESVYIDLLLATNKKHKSLISDILSNRMYTLSMGCSVLQTQCTKCGNVAEDERYMCKHILNEKGSSFFDEEYNKNKVAELCGHKSLDPHGGVNFIDASWVQVPAFTGAVLRNILNPSDVSEYEIKTANDLFYNIEDFKDSVKNKYSFQRLAKLATINSMYKNIIKKAQDEEGEMDFGGEEGGEGEVENTPTEENKKLYEIIQDKGYELASQIMKNRILEELSKDWNTYYPNIQKNNPAFSTYNNPLNSNNNLVKEARYLENIYNLGIENIRKISSNSHEFIKNIRNYNNSFGINIPDHLYKTAFLAGNISDYYNQRDYIGTCSRILNKNASFKEAKVLLKLGNLLKTFQEF